MDLMTGKMYKDPVKGRTIDIDNLLNSIIMNEISMEESDDILEETIDKFHAMFGISVVTQSKQPLYLDIDLLN